jgi:glutathione S-transferase
MSIRLHINPLSQHARRVQMAVIELGLDSDVKLVDFGKGEHKSPEFMKHNPNGKVPVLEDNGFWLWESNAILCYLADQKSSPLYPKDPKARADVHRWLFWESAHFGAATNRLTMERVVKPMMMKQQPDATLVADGESNWNRFAAVLNGQLEGKEWVTGTFSIADISLATALTYEQPAQIDTKPYKHLHAWLTRMQTRDSWKKTAPKY